MRKQYIVASLLLMIFVLLTVWSLPQNATAQDITVTLIASDLHNPRGVAVFPDGRLLVVEAGDGSGDLQAGGRISVFSDVNGDGDFDDPDERTVVMCCVLGYNGLTHYGT